VQAEEGMEPGNLDGHEDTPPASKAWEWAGLMELLATCFLVMVLLGAAMGMLLRVLNPRRKARELGQAVHKAARDAHHAAADALAPAEASAEEDANVSV
jgi:hypothetical protein